MMRIFISAWVLVSLGALYGCSKPSDTFSGAKVVTLTNFVGGYIDHYSYDDQGNVAVVQRNNGSKVLYTYAGDSVLVQQVNPSNVVTAATVYLLHGQVQADSSYGLLQAAPNSALYTYDSNGQLLQQKAYTYGNLSTIADFTIGNKNIAVVAVTNAASQSVSRTYYSYSSTTNTTGNQNFGKGFMGIGTLNVVATAVQLNGNGDTTEIINYHYHVNADSNIDTMASYNRSGQLVDSMAYSY